MAATKKVKVLCESAVSFSIGDIQVPVNELTVEQAEAVAAQYPGLYVEVTGEPSAKSAETTK